MSSVQGPPSPDPAPLSPGAWQQIRRGRRPDRTALSAVAQVEVATDGVDGAAAVRRELEAHLLGAGPLEPLLTEPGVTDVAVNGDGSVWVDRGDGMEPADVDVGGPEALRRLAVRLAGLAGRRLDETSPYVDGVLTSGVRLHAVLPPIVADGPHLTLRVPARTAHSLTSLDDAGMFPPGVANLLQRIVRSRIAFLITGGTGVGKTTLLGAMLGAADPTERVVVVEDVRELPVDLPQVVRLEARPPNVEGAGEVTLTALVRQALRMRPDRLVLGEARGAEVRELLAALNTGHEGGCGTVHANGTADVVPRLEALGALAGLGPAALHAQFASAIRVVIHLSRVAGARRLVSLGVVVGEPPSRPRVETALTWTAAHGEHGEHGPGWPILANLLTMADPPEPT